jgi:hypothetical protein
MGFDDCIEITILCKLGIHVVDCLLIITTLIPRYSPFACCPFPITAEFDDVATSEISQTFVSFYLFPGKNPPSFVSGVDTFHHNLLIEA